MNPPSLPHRARDVCITSILLVAVGAATIAGVMELAQHNRVMSALQHGIGVATITGISALGAGVVVFSALWHLIVGASRARR